MAGDWIKMQVNLDTNPHVLGLSEILNTNVFHSIGMLWKVWSWADSHSLDGNALNVTEVTLDRFTDCPGFADALRKVGWLEGRDRALSFPRFAEHNGQTAKNRALCKNRVAKIRNVKNVTTPLPEKRREEKRRIDNPCSPQGDVSAGGSLEPPSIATYCKLFEQWWQTYPRKAGKRKAYQAWVAAGRRIRAARKCDAEEAAGHMLERATAFSATPKGQDPKFCPHPATWLNQDRFDDDPKCWQDAGDALPATAGPAEGNDEILPEE